MERRGPDADTAKAALQKIAKGDDVIARQAREVVEEAAKRKPFAGGPGVRGIQGLPGGGNIQQFQFGGNGGNFRSRTTVINGVQSTTIRDGERVVKIERDPNGPVSITVTDPGKKPQSWKADSVEDLKKKQPEGFKMFEKYNKDNVRLGRLPRMRVPMGLFDDLDRMMGMGGGFGMGPMMMEPMDLDDPFGRRRAARAAKEVKDASLLAQDMAELVKSLKKKSKEPEVARLEAKIEALQRSLARVREQVGK